MALAPVALFVYNRVDNTRQTLQALSQNTLASETEVYVFSDGGRDKSSWKAVEQVREVIRSTQMAAAFKRLILIERLENFYLERNITVVIAQVLKDHDRIIVLEDDIVTSPYYLQYMNEALDLYQNVPRVMHVAGFTNLALDDTPFYFTPHMSGWGWGTWRDRWQKHFKHYTTREEALEGLTAEDWNAIQYNEAFPCLKSLDRKPIPWDICWEIAIYRANGLCLTPGRTMVRNIGLSSGTHFRSWRLLQHFEFDREPQQQALSLSYIENPQKNPDIEALFAQAIRDWGIRYTPLGKVVRYLYKKVCAS